MGTKKEAMTVKSMVDMRVKAEVVKAVRRAANPQNSARTEEKKEATKKVTNPKKEATTRAKKTVKEKEKAKKAMVRSPKLSKRVKKAPSLKLSRKREEKEKKEARKVVTVRRKNITARKVMARKAPKSTTWLISDH